MHQKDVNNKTCQGGVRMSSPFGTPFMYGQNPFLVQDSPERIRLINLVKQFTDAALELEKLSPQERSIIGNLCAVSVKIDSGLYDVVAQVAPCYAPEVQPKPLFTDTFQQICESTDPLSPDMFMVSPVAKRILFHVFLRLNRVRLFDHRGKDDEVFVFVDWYDRIYDLLRQFVKTYPKMMHPNAAFVLENNFFAECVREQIFDEFGRDIKPYLDYQNAICVREDGTHTITKGALDRINEDRLTTDHVNELKLCKFIDGNNQWLWTDPQRLIRAIFNVSDEEMSTMTTRHRYMQFLYKTFVDAVLEFNKTVEEPDDIIYQRFKEDCLTCNFDAFISHYKGMYAKEIADLMDGAKEQDIAKTYRRAL